MPELSPAAGQQPHDDRRAPADEGTSAVEEPQRRKAVRLVHVTGSLPQQAGIVLVETQPAIATAAKQTADVAALMVVGQPMRGLGQIERLMFRGQDEQLRTGTQRSAARSSGQDQGPGVHATGAKADGRLSPFEQTPSLA
jgi:hypothetical protein